MSSSGPAQIQISDKTSESYEMNLQDEKIVNLPPPVQTSQIQQQENKKVHPAVIIAIWITLSGSVILYNKYILDPKKGLGFNYPIFLTAFHQIFGTIGTRVLQRTTRLLDGVSKVEMSWDRWMRSIVPIAALFSASLIFNNMAYITLSVSFMQMLKAFTSVAVLGLSVAMGLESPNKRTLIIVSCICGGVALASYGEVNFVMSGFICQALGIIFESARLVSIERLLKGVKMDPLVALYYYAPVCGFFLCLLFPLYEGLDPIYIAWEDLGMGILLSNAAAAFCLNIAVVFLIGAASSLVLSLSGVLKDILLVILSVAFMGAPVTFIQMVGYGFALTGLFVFKTKKEVVDQWIQDFRQRLGR